MSSLSPAPVTLSRRTVRKGGRDLTVGSRLPRERACRGPRPTGCRSESPRVQNAPPGPARCPARGSFPPESLGPRGACGRLTTPGPACPLLPAEVVRKVNELIATGQYGRLFAVVHFASHQWKVTAEDLILIENEMDVACGERIRLEKVRLLLCLRDSVTNRVVPGPRVVTGEVSPRRR